MPCPSRRAQVRSFLELSSAEQLFNRLQEKEHFLNLSMLEKDKALEQQRMRVAALSGDRGRAQNALQELQAQLHEAARERETAKSAADAALDLARQQFSALEKALALAQAEAADAEQARQTAEQQLAIQRQLAESRTLEVAALRTAAGAAAERAAEAEARAASLQDALAAAEAQLREAEVQLTAMRGEHAAVTERAMAAEAECAAATADIAAARATADRDAAEVSSAKAAAATAADVLRKAQADAEKLRLRLETRHDLLVEDFRTQATVAQQELRAQAAAAAAAEAERSELQAAQEEAMRAAKKAFSARVAAVKAQRDQLRARLAAAEAARHEEGGGAEAPTEGEGGVAGAERAPGLHEVEDRHEVAAALREAEALRLELAAAVAEAAAVRTDLSMRSAELARANERAQELSATVEGLTTAAEAAQPSTPRKPSPVSLSALSLTPTLPSATEALGSLQVKVAACVKKEEGSAWWWAFQVQVTTAGLSFLLVRRYSQFVRMHQRLRALPLPLDRLPVLPPKQRYSTQSERFAEKRRAALEVYLRDVVADRDLRQTLALQGFLELGALLGRTFSLHTPGTDAFASPGMSSGGFASSAFTEPRSR
jgi:hypothetical protein